MKRALGMMVTLLALAACDKPAETKTDEAKNAATTTNATSTGAAATAVTPPAPTPVTISEGDLSTPADFEETAEKAITAKTYKADLAALEKEIAKE